MDHSVKQRLWGALEVCYPYARLSVQGKIDKAIFGAVEQLLTAVSGCAENIKINARQTGLEAKGLQNTFSTMESQLLVSQKRAFRSLLQLLQLPSVETASRGTNDCRGGKNIDCGCSGCNVCIVGGTGTGKTLLIKTLVNLFSASTASKR